MGLKCSTATDVRTQDDRGWNSKARSNRLRCPKPERAFQILILRKLQAIAPNGAPRQTVRCRENDAARRVSDISKDHCQREVYNQSARELDKVDL